MYNTYVFTDSQLIQYKCYYYFILLDIGIIYLSNNIYYNKKIVQRKIIINFTGFFYVSNFMSRVCTFMTLLLKSELPYLYKLQKKNIKMLGVEHNDL